MLMDTLLGTQFLLFIFLFILIFVNKNLKIRKILIVAFFIRTLFVVLEQFQLIKLPDGNSTNSDAYSFIKFARLYSNEQGLLILADFFVQDSKFISRIISIFFTIFGESIMMAKSISVALGISSVYLTYTLSEKLWGNRSAEKAAWIVALYPSLVLYSVITLREVYVVFFLLIALNGIAKYFENKSFYSLIQIFFGFYILSLFHGPMALGGLIFFAYLIISKVKYFLLKIKTLKISLFSLTAIIILILPLFLFINFNIKFPYMGTYQQIVNPEYIIKISNYGFRGEASYPNWLIINETYEIFTKTIFRVIYFLYSPFVWNIEKLSHYIAFLDGSFGIILSIYLIKNWREILNNPIARILILILICYLILYGIGTANFGTVFRHRSKFIVILVILAAPKIHKFIFSFKKKTI